MVMLRIEYPVPNFEGWKRAEALLAAMRVVWGRVEGKIMTNPKSRIVEVSETRTY